MRHDALDSATRLDRTAPQSAGDALDNARVEAIRRGDPAAFEEVYRVYYRSLVGFVYTYVRSEPVAEEEVQDLFLAVWRHRDQWAPRTTLRAYLYKAARNRALNRLRDDGVTVAAWENATTEGRTLAMGEAPPPLDQEIEAIELAEAAQRAIARLAPRCRMAFTLCRAEGLSYAETAEVMGISEHTVKIQMGRALKALRIGLANWLP